MIAQLIQISGAVFILTAFLLLQVNVLTAKSYWYLLLNLTGSIILALNAYTQDQWGFLLLQIVWAFVSLIALTSLTVARRKSISPIQ